MNDFAGSADAIAEKLVAGGMDPQQAMTLALRMAQSRQQADQSILGGVPTQPPVSDVPPATEILGGDPAKLFQRQPTTMERIRDLPKDVLGAADAMASMGSLVGLAVPSMMYALRPGQKTQGDPMEFALRNMYMPRSERGPSHLAGLGEVLESLPQTGPLPELQAFTGVGRGVGKQLAEKGKQIKKAKPNKAGQPSEAKKDGGTVNHKAVASARRALEKAIARGGAVKMAGGGSVIGKAAAAAAKQARTVLSPAESEANLQKMLAESRIKERLYHGTTATEGGKGEEAIRRIKPSKEGSLGAGAYLTPKADFASSYAESTGGNVLPVYAQIKKPLIIEGKGDPMIEALVKLGMDEDKASRMVERAYENKGYIGKEVQLRALSQGYDGLMQYRNGDLAEVVVYNPNAIKSATGNQGTYDITSPELSKAHGGLAHMSGGGVLGKVAGKAAGKAGAKAAKAGSEAAERIAKNLQEAADKGQVVATPAEIDRALAASAKRIGKDNPKLTPDEIEKKAARDVEARLKWERIERPSVVKEFGQLVDEPYTAPKARRLQNVPAEVEARAAAAEEFLRQPTEPWQPPKPGLQAFDRSLIKESLEGFPGVEQTRFPRYQPARADIGYVGEMYDNPRNRELIKQQIKRGLPLGGETFYGSLYPLKVAALERGIPAEKFEQFIYQTAPASARNSIINEMAVGQFLRDMNARGLPLDEQTVAKEMANFKQKYGIGLPLMPVHRQGVQQVIEGGTNLREQVKADIPTNYKIPTYGTQKAGDFGKSVVLDVHEAAGETLGSQYHPYFTRQGGFGPTEYGIAESKMLDIANELGIPGGMAQAGRWFGGGELTGLKSPRGDALDLLEKQTAYTLQGQGIKPTPRNVRNYILDMIDTGQGVLMPYFKSEAMPDVRTMKKKGGAVKLGGLSVLRKKHGN